MTSFREVGVHLPLLCHVKFLRTDFTIALRDASIDEIDEIDREYVGCWWWYVAILVKVPQSWTGTCQY